MDEQLADLKSEIMQMQRDITHGPKKPHKLVMLLAVIDLFEKGLLIENKIPFDKMLLESFSNIFNLIRIKGEWNQPAPPFFHLRTSRFWKHKIKVGREAEYAKLTTSGGGKKRIVENIEYAYLSDDCFEIFSTELSRQEIREFIITLVNPFANFGESNPVKATKE